jgi:hypothetical protein
MVFIMAAFFSFMRMIKLDIGSDMHAKKLNNREQKL